MEKLMIPAKEEHLDDLNAFLEEKLDAHGVSMKASMQLQLAAEEIFVNIASYAYSDREDGMAAIEVDFTDAPAAVEIRFIDSGIPYDPLAKEDPDVSLSAEERQIGGLGIFMVKKSMDYVGYAYLDGQNVLTIRKML